MTKTDAKAKTGLAESAGARPDIVLKVIAAMERSGVRAVSVDLDAGTFRVVAAYEGKL